MSINNATNGITDALVNEIAQLRRDFDEYKSTPQPIGNGSIAYAVYSSAITFGPTTIASGNSFNFYFTSFAVDFTYNNLPAIAKRTLMDILVSVYIDANDGTHIFPMGASVNTIPMHLSVWNDYAYSNLAETGSGSRRWYIQIRNIDTVSHTYYVYANALFPRPALKPQ